MAKKPQTVWICQECGYESPKYMGRCICGAWNSFVEEKVLPAPQEDTRRRTASRAAGRTSRPIPLKSVTSADRDRIPTAIRELDRVLGGGLVKGSLTLISGEPGIGKSTLIIQAAAEIARRYGTVLYVSGEESEEQIKMRADRVCSGIPDNLLVMSETNIDNVQTIAEDIKPVFLIIDSIQTMYTDQLDSAPGSVSQVRACGGILMKIGKTNDIPIFIVAHVTKSGDLAGPKIVEHLVDCVLSFSGERDHEIRILRAFKNRFGTTSEIGAFRMESEGMIGIEDLSGTFLENPDEQQPGSVVTAVYEGSRPVLLEIQALTSQANVGFPRRTAVGIDYQRLNMILAVLEKRAGIPISTEDVYANVVGGLKPDSTSVDLGVALAVYSSVRNITPAAGMIAIGEVGLTGGLRSVQNADKIAAEAAKLGYTKILMPQKNADRIKNVPKGCKIVGLKDIIDAVEAFKY